MESQNLCSLTLLIFDFEPCMQIEGQHVDTVEEMRLLGPIFSNDLKWKANTDAMIKKAYARLWMVKRLKSRGANLTDPIDVYIHTWFQGFT